MSNDSRSLRTKAGAGSPVIVVRDQVMTQPTVAELRRLLEEEDILPPAAETKAAGVKGDTRMALTKYPLGRSGLQITRVGFRSWAAGGRNCAGGIIGMKTFGASAPLKALQQKFGFEPDRNAAAAKGLLGKL